MGRILEALYTENESQKALPAWSYFMELALATGVVAYAGISGTEPAPVTHMSYRAAYYDQQQTHPGPTTFACETGRIVMSTLSEGHVYLRTIAEDTPCHDGPLEPTQIDKLTE